MCANIGVDPLASNKGVWAQVFASVSYSCLSNSDISPFLRSFRED